MENKIKRITAVIFSMIIMTVTAASDALRGVFLPEFRAAFSLNEAQASHIIMMSYVGNLIFLSVGGYLSDRLPRKKFLGGLILLWIASLSVYIFTENYAVLLVTIIFSMGASTMTATSVNMLTPLIFASPAFFVNFFNFCQGAGITASQNIGGRFADSLKAWHIANGIILSAAVISFILLMTLDLPDPEPKSKSEKVPYKDIFKAPATYFLIIISGSYFIAEHGLQNWLTTYGSEYLGFTVSSSAFYLSLFFGGLTVGRLIFAPLVQKLGIFRSMLIWSAAAAVLYTIGILMRQSGIILVAVSGLGFSILYPTLVLLIGKFYEPSVSGTATGTIFSISTLADVLFNAVFGSAAEKFGYGNAILMLPVSMCIFSAMLFALRFYTRSSYKE